MRCRPSRDEPARATSQPRVARTRPRVTAGSWRPPAPPARSPPADRSAGRDEPRPGVSGVGRGPRITQRSIRAGLVWSTSHGRTFQRRTEFGMSSSARRRTRRFALASCSRSHARIQIARVRRMRHAQASHRGCVASARHGTALDASGVSRPRPLQSQSGISRRNASVQCCWSESRKGRAGSGRAAADLLNWNGQLRITCPNTQQRARAQAEVWAQARGCSVARNEPTLLDRLWDVLDSLDQHLLRIFRRTSAARCKWRTSSRLAIERCAGERPACA